MKILVAESLITWVADYNPTKLIKSDPTKELIGGTILSWEKLFLDVWVI